MLSNCFDEEKSAEDEWSICSHSSLSSCVVKRSMASGGVICSCNGGGVGGEKTRAGMTSFLDAVGVVRCSSSFRISAMSSSVLVEEKMGCVLGGCMSITTFDVFFYVYFITTMIIKFNLKSAIVVD